ncbi:MAG: metal ABC transporter permease [Lachnospiraceae bacterium]|nr:metal ABC transporter permease [Lachnospiraceae bacterium]
MSAAETLKLFFSYPFVRYAFVVAVVISLSASLLGVTLVLKRYSFIGDGLSHVAFGAMAIASVFKMINNNVIVLPLTILAAVLLLRTGKNAKIKGDAAIAVFSVGALAVGYLIINVFSTSANVSGDVCSTLFGSTSLLTLTAGEVWFSVILAAIVTGLFVFLYNKIFAVTFDEDFANATGTNADRYNLIIAILIAVIIVMGMNLVGSLLISALVIFPALSAMRLYNNYRGVVICSAVIAVICAVTGMLLSILLSTPVGATIVTADIVVFAAVTLIKSFFK